MNYGTAIIYDGVLVQKEELPNSSMRRGAVRYAEYTTQEIVPVAVAVNGNSTFVVELNYRDYRRLYRDGSSLPTASLIEYQKKFRRIASNKNVISDLKSFVANYSGELEASKLRKRSIALGRIHKSISGEVFKFPIRDI